MGPLAIQEFSSNIVETSNRNADTLTWGGGGGGSDSDTVHTDVNGNAHSTHWFQDYGSPQINKSIWATQSL